MALLTAFSFSSALASFVLSPSSLWSPSSSPASGLPVGCFWYGHMSAGSVGAKNSSQDSTTVRMASSCGHRRRLRHSRSRLPLMLGGMRVHARHQPVLVQISDPVCTDGTMNPQRTHESLGSSSSSLSRSSPTAAASTFRNGPKRPCDDPLAGPNTLWAANTPTACFISHSSVDFPVK